MRSYLLALLLVIFSGIITSQTLLAQPDHSTWDALLQQYVTASGKVDYRGIKQDKARLQTYLDHLTGHPVQSSWSKAEQLSYWINAYNAFTVKLIVDNYPVNSITELHGGKPWDVKWIKLGKTTYSLNQIENEIIRPQFNEPRIHFAVNCAAKSCPPLLNRAYTADQLENQLERQTKAFVNNDSYNSIQPKSVAVSKIFEWYADDFGKLITFLNQFSDNRIQSSAKISYQEYDWALNKQ